MVVDSQTEQGKLEEASRLADRRATIYDFFAEQLTKPPLPEEHAKQTLLDHWRSVAQASDAEPAREIVAFLEAENFDGEALNLEFSDLFSVPAGRYLSPIESVYLGASVHDDRWRPGLLRGQAWARVNEWYRRTGYRVPAETGFEADHLACELQFLAVLCRAEQQAWRHGDFDAAKDFRSTQRQFLQDHPLAWIGLLRGRLARVSDSLYYNNLLSLIHSHLQTESDHLQD